jgi:hypothetical protein
VLTFQRNEKAFDFDHVNVKLDGADSFLLRPFKCTLQFAPKVSANLQEAFHERKLSVTVIEMQELGRGVMNGETIQHIPPGQTALEETDSISNARIRISQEDPTNL